MDRWEYKLVKGDEVHIKVRIEFFNALGAEGWELSCSTYHAGDAPNFYFKRRIESNHPYR